MVMVARGVLPQKFPALKKVIPRFLSIGKKLVIIFGVALGLFMLGVAIKGFSEEWYLKDHRPECEEACLEDEEAHVWLEEDLIMCTCSATVEDVFPIGSIPCN